MRQYTQLPMTLYRIQPRLPVALRDRAKQESLGRTSFDLELHIGKVLPMPVATTKFHTLNGMSLRPAGSAMERIRNFRGSPTVYTLRGGMTLPDHLCVWHEHSDHWSLQAAAEMTLGDLNDRLTEFLKGLP